MKSLYKAGLIIEGQVARVLYLIIINKAEKSFTTYEFICVKKSLTLLSVKNFLPVMEAATLPGKLRIPEH